MNQDNKLQKSVADIIAIINQLEAEKNKAITAYNELDRKQIEYVVSVMRAFHKVELEIGRAKLLFDKLTEQQNEDRLNIGLLQNLLREHNISIPSRLQHLADESYPKYQHLQVNWELLEKLVEEFKK